MNKIILYAMIAASSLTYIANAQGREITIEDVTESWDFYPERPRELMSTADGRSYTMLSQSGRQIEQYSYATGDKEGTLVDLDNLKGQCGLRSISGYEISSTGEFVMIWGNVESIYRRSYKADHYVIDVAHNESFRLSEGGGEQEASFAPNGMVISYIKGNDIHLFKLKYRSTSDVTKDGEKNKIINGIPDWVYEEEFTTSRAYAWSADSRQIAYVKFDESDVKEYSFPVYKASNPTVEGAGLYPEEYRYKYPKAGEENSKVSVHIYDLDSRVTKDVDLGRGDYYVPRILWSGVENQLCVLKLNRLQNKMEVIGVNSRSLVSTVILTEEDERYVDEAAYLDLTYIDGGNKFIIRSDRDGWSHLYLYESNGTMKKCLTKGDFDVTEFYGVDPTGGMMYYQAAKKTPMDREVYAYNMKKGTTVAISEEPGENSASFSKTFNYYVRKHSSVTHVPTYTVCDSKGKDLRDIVDNSRLNFALRYRFFAPKEFMQVPGADGTMLNAWVMKPRDFSEDKRYPLLMVQYSGPNSQQVLNTWSLDWCQTLASRGYIVACVDPRGTGARGVEFRKCTYRQLGRYESDDQIAAAIYFGSLPYVNPGRIGIYGWSFGGFMSTLCLCKTEVFKMGIAVAPVISWRYYDTVYTERFMRTPEENAAGYDDNSPLSHAETLHGKYLIIAGTADDNVHCQNQMEMVDALVQAGKQFDMFTYPNRNHGIYGGRCRQHLYTMKLNYVLNNL